MPTGKELYQQYRARPQAKPFVGPVRPTGGSKFETQASSTRVYPLAKPIIGPVRPTGGSQFESRIAAQRQSVLPTLSSGGKVDTAIRNVVTPALKAVGDFAFNSTLGGLAPRLQDSETAIALPTELQKAKFNSKGKLVLPKPIQEYPTQVQDAIRQGEEAQKEQGKAFANLATALLFLKTGAAGHAKLSDKVLSKIPTALQKPAQVATTALAGGTENVVANEATMRGQGVIPTNKERVQQFGFGAAFSGVGALFQKPKSVLPQSLKNGVKPALEPETTPTKPLIKETNPDTGGIIERNDLNEVVRVTNKDGSVAYESPDIKTAPTKTVGVKTKPVDPALPVEQPRPSQPKTEAKSPLHNEDLKYKSAEEWELDNFTPEQIAKRRTFGVDPNKEWGTMYRGTSLAEWSDIQTTGKLGNKPQPGTPKGSSFVTDDLNYIKGHKAVQADMGSEGVIIEFKPTAKIKTRVLDSGEGSMGRGLTLDDVAKVTDKNGKVIYEATTGGKTKSQLTSIYNEAHTPKALTETPTPEVKKVVSTPESRKVVDIPEPKMTKQYARSRHLLDEQTRQQLDESANYEQIKLDRSKEEALKIVGDEARLKRILSGDEELPGSVTEGDFRKAYEGTLEGDKYGSELLKNSLFFTKAGQTISSLRNWISATDPELFVRKIIQRKLEKLGKGQIKNGKTKGSDLENGMKRLEAEAEKIKTKLTPAEKMEIKIAKANKLISAITCKP